MEKSDRKQKQDHEQHILSSLQQQVQQQKQDYSDHVCRKRAQAAQAQGKVQGSLVREVNQEVKLAATAISLNVRLRSSSTNMPHHMQDRALRHTRSLIDSAAAAAKAISAKPRPNPTHLARALKKEFDSLYGPAWHCVVGKSFGSFVTHSPGASFIFLSTTRCRCCSLRRRFSWSPNNNHRNRRNKQQSFVESFVRMTPVGLFSLTSHQRCQI